MKKVGVLFVVMLLLVMTVLAPEDSLSMNNNETLKIYSWNMDSYNDDPENAFNFIQNLDFDVLVLQEVPSEFLEKLNDLNYNLEASIDYKRFLSKRNITLYHVIITPHTILKTESFEVSSEPNLKLRTTLFVGFMNLFGWTKISGYSASYVDIVKTGKQFRIFSTHFSNKSPSERRNELGRITQKLAQDQDNIICGDFNIIDQSVVKPITYLLGGSLKEASPLYPEREIAEGIFEENGFINPLRENWTHTLFRSQLDHILIPKEQKILQKMVLDESYGSDHYPIFVEISID